jgi:L-amino acid N-acyltransferase YncA
MSSNPIQLDIRDVTDDDADAIVAILNPIIAARVYTVFDTPFTGDEERAFIRGFPARGVFHVAVNRADNTVVGLQNVEPLASYTRAFDHVGVIGTFVQLGLRRQGIATKLFDATLSAVLAKGYEKLFTYVRADNPAALQTYRAQGFRVVGTAEKHATIDGRYVDEIVIEKILSRPPAAPHGTIVNANGLA